MRLWGLALAALALAGCSGASVTSSSADDPYRAEYEQAIANTSSDFVRDILADHTITAAERNESQNGLITCLQDEGFHPLVDVENGYRMVNVPADAGPECPDAWDGGIDQLYLTIQKNPHHADMDVLVAACFVRLGLAPDGFSGNDLKDLLDAETWSYTELEDGTRIDDAPATNPNGSELPSGMKIHAPETQDCWQSPLTTGFE